MLTEIPVNSTSFEPHRHLCSFMLCCEVFPIVNNLRKLPLKYFGPITFKPCLYPQSVDNRTLVWKPKFFITKPNSLFGLRLVQFSVFTEICSLSGTYFQILSHVCHIFLFGVLYWKTFLGLLIYDMRFYIIGIIP